MTRSLCMLRHNLLSRFIQTCLPAMFAASMGHSATCAVNSSADDPATASSAVTNATVSGTLRDCILAANLMTGSTGAPNGTMAINMSAIAGQTITLGDALPLIFNNTTIDAGNGVAVTIDGADAHRIFFVSGLPPIPISGKPDPDGAQAITVAMHNLQLQHGLAKGGDASKNAGGGMGAGGALFINQLATVILSNVRFSGNAASGGSLGSTGGGGGGGMGPGWSGGAGGGGLGAGSIGGAAGVGTTGTAIAAGGWGGQGLGQLSGAQGFIAADFDVDSGGGASGLGLIGGGGFLNDGGGFGGGGGVGGDGGFGGGGGAATVNYHGNGGFGGGGGYTSSFAGRGGFGGGGAAGTGYGGYNAPGVGGGKGEANGGGGGAGFGGAVFVRSSASLTFQDGGRVGGGSVTAGQGYAPGGNGAAAGIGFFLMSGATTTFDIADTYTINDTLSDDSTASLPCCFGFVPGTGAGVAITKKGVGILILSGANTYAGTTSVNAGTLGGNGDLIGPVILASGAQLAPGDAATKHGVGTLSIGPLTWKSGGAMAFQLGAGPLGSDFLLVDGALTKSGTGPFRFHFGIGASPPVVGTTYTLISSMDSSAFSPSAFSFDKDAAYGNLVGHFAVDAGYVKFTVDSVASDHLFADGFD